MNTGLLLLLAAAGYLWWSGSLSSLFGSSTTAPSSSGTATTGATNATIAAPILTAAPTTAPNGLPLDAVFFAPLNSGETFRWGSEVFKTPGNVYFDPALSEFFLSPTSPTADQANAGNSFSWPLGPVCGQLQTSTNANGQQVSSQPCQMLPPAITGRQMTLQAPPVSMAGLGHLADKGVFWG